MVKKPDLHMANQVQTRLAVPLAFLLPFKVPSISC